MCEKTSEFSEEEIYSTILKNSKDPFEIMLEMQKSLQEALFLKNPETQDVNNLKTLGQKYDWLRDNKVALDDEFREVVDALAGINKPVKERSALWKKWKKNYFDLRNEKFDDLTEEEKREFKLELCDMFHFFMNLMLACEISAKEMFELYYYKNRENFERIKNNY